MVTKFVFLQDLFGILKNGQKKCPKLKTQNTFGKRKSLKYDKFPNILKENRKIMQIFSIHPIASMPSPHNYASLTMCL